MWYRNVRTNHLPTYFPRSIARKELIKCWNLSFYTGGSLLSCPIPRSEGTNITKELFFFEEGTSNLKLHLLSLYMARDIDLHIVSCTYVTVHEPSTLTPNSRAVKKKMHRKKEHFQELVNRGLTNSVMYTNKQD